MKPSLRAVSKGMFSTRLTTVLQVEAAKLVAKADKVARRDPSQRSLGTRSKMRQKVADHLPVTVHRSRRRSARLIEKPIV